MQKHFAVVTGITMLAIAGVVVSQQSGVFDSSLKGNLMTTGFTGGPSPISRVSSSRVSSSSNPSVSCADLPVCGRASKTCGEASCGTLVPCCKNGIKSATMVTCNCSSRSSNYDADCATCSCTLDPNGAFQDAVSCQASMVANCANCSPRSSSSSSVDVCGGGCQAQGLVCDGVGECVSLPSSSGG